MKTFKDFYTTLLENIKWNAPDTLEGIEQVLSLTPTSDRSKINEPHFEHNHHVALLALDPAKHGRDKVEEILRRHHNHSNSWIRRAVAKHPHIEQFPDLHDALKNDKNKEVARLANAPRKGTTPRRTTGTTGTTGTTPSTKTSLPDFEYISRLTGHSVEDLKKAHENEQAKMAAEKAEKDNQAALAAHHEKHKNAINALRDAGLHDMANDLEKKGPGPLPAAPASAPASAPRKRSAKRSAKPVFTTKEETPTDEHEAITHVYKNGEHVGTVKTPRNKKQPHQIFNPDGTPTESKFGRGELNHKDVISILKDQD